MIPKSNVVTVTENATLAECLSLMNYHNVRHLPVLGGSDPVGMLVSFSSLFIHFVEPKNALTMSARDGFNI